MDAPRYSVVIPAFNAERTIRSAVQSALSQTETDLEVIVVDDGSRDSTSAIAAAIPDPRVQLVGQENRGQSAARNVGINASRARYVAFLDSDDLWLPDYLAVAGAALDAAPRAGFVYTDAHAFATSSGSVRRQTAMEGMRPPSPPPVDRDTFLLELLQRNFVFVSAMVRRSGLTEVGGYNEALEACEDYDLWLRILLQGYVAAWVPGQHALYRIHAGQMSQNPLKMCRARLAMFRAFAAGAMPTDAHRELLTRRIQAEERELRVLNGDARLGSSLRRMRWRLGRLS